MKHLLIAALLALFTVSTASADEPTERALAEELMALNNVQQNVERMFAQMKEAQVAMLKSLELPEDKVEEAQALQARLLEVLDQELSWPSLKEEYLDVYTEVFSREELEKLLEFSKSEVGRSINAKMPQLMQKTMAIGQRHSQQAIPKMQKVVEEFFKNNPPAQ